MDLSKHLCYFASLDFWHLLLKLINVGTLIKCEEIGNEKLIDVGGEWQGRAKVLDLHLFIYLFFLLKKIGFALLPDSMLSQTLIYLATRNLAAGSDVCKKGGVGGWVSLKVSVQGQRKTGRGWSWKMDIFHARHMCTITKTSVHIFDLIARLSQEARGCMLTGLGAISDLYQN